MSRPAYAADAPHWDKQEVDYYETFLGQRDKGDYRAAASTAGQWLEYASKSEEFEKSYYAFVQEADYTDFHESVLSEAWRELAVDENSDDNELIQAVGAWLQYLKVSYGDGDPRTVAGYIALTDILKKDKRNSENVIKFLKRAESAATEARSEEEESVPTRLYLGILQRLVTALQTKGKNDEAATYQSMTEVLMSREKPNGGPDRLSSGKPKAIELNVRVLQLYSLGNYEEAVAIAQNVVTLCEPKENEASTAYVTSLNNLAKVYQAMGAYEKAESLYLQAKEISAKSLGTDHPGYASILDNLAELYQTMGASEKAEPLYLQAEEVRGSIRGSDVGNYHKVQIFFGTDRKATGQNSLNQSFGVEQADNINYGTCLVSVPLKHKRGETERPTWWKLEFREDPTKHVSILEVAPVAKDGFYSNLGADIKERAGESGSKKAFVFVHGFNVTFAAAARHTAQIAHDISFEGVPIFFSWASRGSVGNYITDETTIQLSQDYLEEFLVDIANQTEVEEVYLIAHSMGTRALTKAFPSVYEKLGARNKIFKEIILAAPDIDRRIFLRQIAPALASTKIPVTIYASKNDRALKTSKAIRADLPRLGEDAEVLAGLPILEPIDASIVHTDFTGHSYFSDDKSLTFDMLQLINDAKRAADRTGTLSEAIAEGGKKFWQVRP